MFAFIGPAAILKVIIKPIGAADPRFGCAVYLVFCANIFLFKSAI
jgi:hypothetical protein